MKLVAFSDTHGQHEQVTIPECDVVVFAGDCCKYGSRDEFTEFVNWYAKVPAEFKILTPGNHDICTEKYFGFAKQVCDEWDIIYLADRSCILNHVVFYGFPWTPPYGNYAWMMDDDQMLAKLESIACSPDVFISHGPPAGILDYTERSREWVGSTAIRRYVTDSWLLPTMVEKDVSLHIFGHIHENYGTVGVRGRKTLFANISVLDLQYEMNNKPMTFELETSLLWSKV